MSRVTPWRRRMPPAARLVKCPYVSRHESHGISLNFTQAEDVESNALYLAEVSIGTPPQKMDLDFDTGSADLWVWSSKLPERTQQATSSDGQKHNIFNPSESSTYQQTNSTWQIQYVQPLYSKHSR